jgi:hypothetical protein
MIGFRDGEGGAHVWEERFAKESMKIENFETETGKSTEPFISATVKF